MRKEFLEILKNGWKSEEFRNLKIYENPEWDNSIVEISQGEIIDKIVTEYEKNRVGKKFKDMFITAPTGSGKSVLFQIPAIYLGERYKALTLVVSPLKALMKDQVEALKSKGIKNSAYINGELSYLEREEVISKIGKEEIDIVYISPELLSSSSAMKNILGKRELGLVVIDEAHTVSTWGMDFRVDYLFLGKNLKSLKYLKGEFPIITFTATAVYGGTQDTVFEIMETLNMKTPEIIIGSVKRENIEFKISKEEKKVNYVQEKGSKIMKIIKEKVEKDEKTIIYFPYKSLAKTFFLKLDEKIQNSVVAYHGELTKEERELADKGFRDGSKTVMLATKAFGMGVDIQNIEAVYHFAPTGDLADYIQEIGRAGRKTGGKGVAEIEFYEDDMKYQRTLKSLSGIKQWQTKLVLDKLVQLNSLNQGSEKFLIDVESFSYIFSKKDSSDLERRALSSLLSIEKDLYNRFGRGIISVKSKPLLATTYVSIKKERENEIITEETKKFFTLVSKNEENTRKSVNYNFDKTRNEIVYKSQGDIFQFHMEEYWKEFHEEISYQHFQYKFFSGKIFDNDLVNTRKKLNISLNESKDSTREEFFKKINEIFKEVETLDGYFFKEDLEKKLENCCSDKRLAKNLSNILLAIYGVKSEGFVSIPNHKIFKISVSEVGERYCLLKRNVGNLRLKLAKVFDEYLPENKKENIYSRYIPMNSEGIYLAHLLQALELGYYEINGGDNPKISIEIKDVKALTGVALDKKYSNSVLTEKDRKSKESQKILSYFFHSSMENRERWDLVENFFLGRELSA